RGGRTCPRRAGERRQRALARRLRLVPLARRPRPTRFLGPAPTGAAPRLAHPIHGGGLRSPLPQLRPGERANAEVAVLGPIPPGRYRLAFDLVLEGRYWLISIRTELACVSVAVRTGHTV